MESAINAPHPDEPDEADLFFGDDDDAETPPAPEFDPVSQTLDPAAEPEPTEAGSAKPEPAAEDPTPPAESDGPTEPDPQPAAETAAAAAPDSESGPETPAEPDPTPVSVETPSPESETPATSEPDPTPASSTAAEGSDDKARGALEREYLVFHKLSLTEKALRFLLAEIEEGRAPEPRVAYFQVHRVTTRNVNSAVADAYTQQKDTLGEKVDLAAVSERAFQHRHVEPKQKVEATLSIT